jgi:serine protease Do
MELMSAVRGIRRTRRYRVAVTVALAVLLTGCSGLQQVIEAADPTPAPPLPTASPYDASADPVVAVVDRVAPAVVNVTTSTVTTEEILGGNGGRGVGTGFIIRSDGIVVTNFHVVEGATSIRVTLPPPDGRGFDARVIGGDSDHDLAVLRLEDAEDMPTIPLADSSELQLGQRVIALGYALALEGGPTVTTGIVSSLTRTIDVEDPAAGVTRTLQDVLQTDAAINPGNSGGPLVDLAGNVVGINTAGAGQAENVGFAIAVEAARPFIDRAVENPEAPAAYLGVSTVTITSSLASQLGLPVQEGALVQGLAPGGPAQRAGVRPGDVIVAFEGEAVPSSERLQELILDREAGDEVEVTVIDESGDRRTLSVTLAIRPLPVP